MRINKAPLILLLIVSFSTGCARLPVPMAHKAPEATLTQQQQAYYAYSPVALQATLEATEYSDNIKKEAWVLSHPTDTAFKPIRIDWYHAAEPGPQPVVLVSPILAGNDLFIREFATFFAQRNMHGIIIYRPKEKFSTERGLEDIETHFKESIQQVRMGIDWLETKDNVDAQQIGSFGISMGAILGTLLAAIEPRIKASVLGLPAGNIPDIIMTTNEKGVKKRRNNYLKERNITYEQAYKKLQEVIVSDPLLVAGSIDPQRVMMITAVFDRVLGINRALELWNAMHRPKLILLPTGHISAALAIPYLKLVTYSFLKRQLAEEATQTTP